MRSPEKKNQQLSMKINLLRMQPDIIIPATSGVDRYLSLLKVECRRLASDQEVRDARAAHTISAIRFTKKNPRSLTGEIGMRTASTSALTASVSSLAGCPTPRNPHSVALLIIMTKPGPARSLC